MSSNANSWSALDPQLQQDIDTSRQLLDTLAAERRLLETRDYDQIETLIAHKLELIGALERNAAARLQWLQQHGFANEADALAAARQQAPATARLWHDAAEVWRECQTANQINEQVCRRTRLVVENLLDILRGSGNQSSTYDAKGLARRSQTGRTISNA